MPTTMPGDLESIRMLVEAVRSMATVVVVPIAVGAGLVGLALLLWGRILHRAALVLIAFPMGMGLGAILAEQIHVNVWLGVFAVAVTLTILVIVLARVVWALLAGFWLACFAAFLTGLLVLGDLTPATQPGWHPTAGSSPSGMPSSSARWAACRSTARSSRWRQTVPMATG